MRRAALVLAVVLALVGLALGRGGRGGKGRGSESTLRKCKLRIDYWDDDVEPTMGVVARVMSTPDSLFRGRVTGFVHIEQQRHNMPVRITGQLTGLLPELKSGMYLVTHGRGVNVCNSAGGTHYNPLGKDHGAATDCIRHIGDLDQVSVDEDGNANFTFWDGLLNLQGPYSIIGRAIVFLLEPEDNSQEQATRIACGVFAFDADSNFTITDFHTPGPEDTSFPIGILVFCVLLTVYGYTRLLYEHIYLVARHRYRIEDENISSLHKRRVSRNSKNKVSSFKTWLR